MRYERRITVGVTCLLLVAAWCVRPSSSQAAGVSITSSGGTAISAGGTISSSGFSLGGSFGYFVADNLLPGVRYWYTLNRDSDPYYRAAYHDVSLFVRYYFPYTQRLFPFAVVEPGWHFFKVAQEVVLDESHSEIVETTGDYSTLYGGVGLVVMITNHFGLEPNVGLRQVLGDGSDPELRWWIGLGFYP